jgi:hypothetical protein
MVPRKRTHSGFLPLPHALEQLRADVPAEIAVDWLFDRLSSGVLPSYALMHDGTRKKSVRLRLWESRELADEIITTGIASWNPGDWDDYWYDDWESTEKSQGGTDRVTGKETDPFDNDWGTPEPPIDNVTIAVSLEELLKLVGRDNPPDLPLAPAGYLNTKGMREWVVRRRDGPQWLKQPRDRPDRETSDIPHRRATNDKFREAVRLVAEAAIKGRLEFVVENGLGERRSLPQAQRSPFVETWIRMGRVMIRGAAWFVLTEKDAFDEWLGNSGETVEPASTFEKRTRRPGRKPGDGAFNDDALLEEMHSLILEGKAKSPADAARKVADHAQGQSQEAKIDRLRKKYHRRYPRSQIPVGIETI